MPSSSNRYEPCPRVIVGVLTADCLLHGVSTCLWVRLVAVGDILAASSLRRAAGVSYWLGRSLLHQANAQFTLSGPKLGSGRPESLPRMTSSTYADVPVAANGRL